MKWVLDASVALKWFLAEEYQDTAQEVLQAVIAEPEWFAVPELFLFETYAALCRLHPHPLQAFRRGIFRQPMTAELASDADRFRRMGLSAYDACYAALAWQISGTWLTFDSQAHQCLAVQGISCLLSEGLPQGWER